MENSATARSLDRINKTLKEVWKYPVFLTKRGQDTSRGLMIPDDTILDSDEELAILANKID